MQVYRRLDIGTAKPTAAERRQTIHYGLDLAEPVAPFSVGEYLKHAMLGIEETRGAGAIPLVVGGTRLYIQALVSSFDAGPPPNPELRAQLTRQIASEGSAVLHAQLREVDPTTAERLHPNDAKRIIRALEVFQTAGRPLSVVQAESQLRAGLLSPLVIALVDDRETLYRRVEARTAAMIRSGWLEEVSGLLRGGFAEGLNAIKAHGYPELAAYLRSELELGEAIERINRNIRHYVRYQLGWIRHMPGIHIVEAVGPVADQAASVLALIESRGPL